MELGKVLPAYQDNEQVRQWRVPIAVYNSTSGQEMKVTSVYEDEGFLCIDVEE